MSVFPLSGKELFVLPSTFSFFSVNFTMGNCSCPGFGSSNRSNSQRLLLNNDQQSQDDKGGMFSRKKNKKKRDLVTIHDPNSKEKPFCRWIELSFYAFAGSSSYNKKQGLYMNRNELSSFLSSVGIYKPSCDDIFKGMDSDICDNRISVNEFVDYFCSYEFNPNCIYLQELIENNENWKYLIKALRIFDIIDINHKGYLIYNEFLTFGNLIGLSNDDTNSMWLSLDKNNTGMIKIDEMFNWYKNKYLKNNNNFIKNENQKIIKQQQTKKYNTFVNDANEIEIDVDNSEYVNLASGDALMTSQACGAGNVMNGIDNASDEHLLMYSQGKKLGDYMKEHLQKDNSTNSKSNSSYTRDYSSNNDSFYHESHYDAPPISEE